MELLVAGLFAVFIWWFSTGVILYLDGLPRSTHAWSLLAITVLSVAALIGLASTSSVTTPLAAYAAFSFAILCWGWQEMTLYLGVITGPRTKAADSQSRGWQRLSHAVQVIIYHELAILLMGLMICAITWQAENQVGLYAYLVLWWMRLSAKMNVFLGVPNHATDFLPDNISYLQTYFTKQPMNLLFPFSVTVSTVIAGLLFNAAVAAPAGSFDEAAYGLLAVLVALAVLEHWFLVLPVPVNALWSWGLTSHEQSRRSGVTTSNDDGEAGTERRDNLAFNHSPTQTTGTMATSGS
ncbi:MAG: putative photosynthetic complex assembly protein PuhE [Pseudomonadota bacterium]